MITSENQRAEIKETIELELLKRGIIVDVSISEKNEKIVIRSTKFQTSPVLFKELHIQDFGSWIKKEDDKLHKCTICISANYIHFEGGSNILGLFTAHFNLFSNEARLISIS